MVTIINHPLIKMKMDILRDENTSNKQFRETIDEIGSLMAFEIFKNLELKETDIKIKTPTNSIINKFELKQDIILTPILRAGLGMLSGIQKMIPNSKTGFIGMYRDEITLQPHEYYFKIPEANNPLIVIIDPMLATGGSSLLAIDAVKKRGYKNIILVNLVGVQQGIDLIQSHHPDVNIYLAALDEKLNNKGYILPGLGDAGDRIFGTD